MQKKFDPRLTALELAARPPYAWPGPAFRAWVNREGKKQKQDHTVASFIEAGRLTDDGGHIFANDPADQDALIIAEFDRLTNAKPEIIYVDWNPAPDEDPDP